MEMRKRVFLLAMILSLVLSFPAYSQEVYKWVDETGNVNFTTRYDWVPEEYRGQIKPPPPGKRLETQVSDFATEEEIRHFFADYTERYNQKDIEGFLSLFSTEAIQNGVYRYDEIRKMYTDFFDKNRELWYYLADLGVEIYQNSVEARARYELDQTSRKRGKMKSWRGDIRWVLIKENEALKILMLDYQPEKSS
jgi:hypothetical protein